jgi:hypothetical protein
MSHFQFALDEHLLHWSWQGKQSKKIGYGASRTTDRVGSSLVSHSELIDEPTDACGFFDRIEVLALYIFDQSHSERGFITHFADYYRHAWQARDDGSTPSSFTSDDLERSVCHGARENGLDDALRLNRFGEVRNSVGVHTRARLIFARPKVVYRYLL